MKRAVIVQRCSNVMATVAVALGVVALTGLVETADAQGVSVAPTRVVFESGERSAGLHLQNSSAQEVTYRLSLQRVRMNENGQMRVVEEHDMGDGERFAHDLIRFSPRQVTLRAGETQRVRLMARTSAQLEEGEYRSHLLFEALPPVDEPSTAGHSGGDDIDISLDIQTNLWIPVIVRHGELKADIEVAGSDIDGEASTIDVRLQRRGGRSVYGTIEIGFRSSDSDHRVVVARRKGVAIYVPNELRRLHLPLSLPDGLGVDDGDFDVAFQETRDSRPRGEPVRKRLEK